LIGDGREVNGTTDRKSGDMKRRNNEGFTLIEVALSIVVVAIGIMAVFSLIGSGLESSKKAISESQAAIFANDVFNSLRSTSQQTNNMVDMQTWTNFWNQLIAQNTNVTAAGEMLWMKGSTTGRLNIVVKSAGAPIMNPPSLAFTNAPVHGGSALTNIQNGGLQYWLAIDGPKNVNGGTSSMVDVRLYVWEGLYGAGATPNPNKALLFYTEYNNPGQI
jgi:prepilin-type N-terminal cleavage/methylation domain-containing protein